MRVDHPRKSLLRPTPLAASYAALLTRFCVGDISQDNFAIGFLEISFRRHFSDNALDPTHRSVLGKLRNRLASKVCEMKSQKTFH